MHLPRFLLIPLIILLAGCIQFPEDSSTDPLPRRSQAADDDHSRDRGDDTGGDSTRDVEPLDDFEEAVAGTWRRSHVANRGQSNEYGYYEYVSFNEDRTACRWKYGQDSSSSYTDDVFSSSDYDHWQITRQLSGGGNSFIIEGAGIDYVFDFNADILYPDGFDTLVFHRNTDGKSCFLRGGSSY